MQLSIDPRLLAECIDELRTKSNGERESMLLWLAKNNDRAQIVSAYVPEYTSRSDQFWISRESMQKLIMHLRRENLFIAGQIHTHPFEAYHSKADDHWAIVRHEGAYSAVLPNFAVGVSLDNFASEVAVYRMTSGVWLKADVSDAFRIQTLGK